jgi:succinate dehydrogenase / fumarate reductase cytochrome b subunit
MKTERPVNLNLFKMSWPIAAIASITHRITGVVLFVGVAFCLYALDLALSSAQGFAEAASLMTQPLARFIVFGLLLALVYHVVAGVKHLLLDFHLGDSLEASRIGAVVVAVATVAITGVLGVLLW